jgi:hypothetical protein
MNATFETVRKELKKYNAEDNDAPPKIVVAGKNDFLDIDHKRKKNSQFIIGVKEFHESERSLIEKMLNEVEIKTGRKPLIFLYDNRDMIEAAIADFEDYYNRPLSKDIIQRFGTSTEQDNLLYYLIIVAVETEYYES